MTSLPDDAAGRALDLATELGMVLTRAIRNRSQRAEAIRHIHALMELVTAQDAPDPVPLGDLVAP